VTLIKAASADAPAAPNLPFPEIGTRMSSELSVRFVTRGDFDRWLPLWDGYNAFYGRSGSTALAREITEMTWSRFFDAYEPVHALVAQNCLG
jgi:hypothetical protein